MNKNPLSELFIRTTPERQQRAINSHAIARTQTVHLPIEHSDQRSKVMFIENVYCKHSLNPWWISMPSFCAVFDCSNRYDREKSKSYYRVPKVITHQGEQAQKLSQARREKWLSNIARDDIKPYDNLRICSDHFISKLYSCHNSLFPFLWYIVIPFTVLIVIYVSI